MERRDREVAQKQSSTYRDEYEGVKKQLFEHQEALSAVEQVNKKLNQEVQRARKECERLEQEVQAKSSQVKQYAKEVERLKQEVYS